MNINNQLYGFNKSAHKKTPINKPINIKTNLYFPFFKNLVINLGWFFIPFYLFVIVGSSNAVNLTDGLDGLATVPVILVAGCFGFISYVSGNIVFADYLLIPYIEDVGEVAVFLRSNHRSFDWFFMV